MATTERQTSRYVIPAGDVIQLKRKERGWNTADLAAEAGCSKPTIVSIEASRQCELFTLDCIAEALAVPLAQLIQQPKTLDPPARHQSYPAKPVELEIKVSIPPELFDQTLHLLNILKQLSNLASFQSNIIVKGIEEGSVLIRLIVSHEDAAALFLALANKGDNLNEFLASLDIDSIRMRLSVPATTRSLTVDIERHHPGIRDDMLQALMRALLPPSATEGADVDETDDDT